MQEIIDLSICNSTSDSDDGVAMGNMGNRDTDETEEKDDHSEEKDNDGMKKTDINTIPPKKKDPPQKNDAISPPKTMDRKCPSRLSPGKFEPKKMSCPTLWKSFGGQVNIPKSFSPVANSKVSNTDTTKNNLDIAATTTANAATPNNNVTESAAMNYPRKNSTAVTDPSDNHINSATTSAPMSASSATQTAAFVKDCGMDDDGFISEEEELAMEAANFQPRCFYRDERRKPVHIPSSYITIKTECMLCAETPPIKACVLLHDDHSKIKGKCKHVYCMSCIDGLIAHRPTRGARNLRGKDYSLNYPYMFKMIVDAFKEDHEFKMACGWSEMLQNERNVVFDMYNRENPCERVTEHVCVTCYGMPITCFQEVSTSHIYRLPMYPIAYICNEPIWTYFEWASAQMLAKVWFDVISDWDLFLDLVAHMEWFLEERKKNPSLVFNPMEYANGIRRM